MPTGHTILLGAVCNRQIWVLKCAFEVGGNCVWLDRKIVHKVENCLPSSWITFGSFSTVPRGATVPTWLGMMTTPFYFTFCNTYNTSNMYCVGIVELQSKLVTVDCSWGHFFHVRNQTRRHRSLKFYQLILQFRFLLCTVAQGFIHIPDDLVQKRETWPKGPIQVLGNYCRENYSLILVSMKNCE